ncbi:hypothetical protein ACP70R_024203 [Stipagrostis hirtigluma subsp. patula]
MAPPPPMKTRLFVGLNKGHIVTNQAGAPASAFRPQRINCQEDDD